MREPRARSSRSRANTSTTRMLVPLVALLVAGPATAADRTLAEAVRARDAEAVRVLLAQHADVNAPLPDGSTALHWAVHWNDLETTTRLIRAGAIVSRPDDYGVTALMLASENGAPPVVA